LVEVAAAVCSAERVANDGRNRSGARFNDGDVGCAAAEVDDEPELGVLVKHDVADAGVIEHRGHWLRHDADVGQAGCVDGAHHGLGAMVFVAGPLGGDADVGDSGVGSKAVDAQVAVSLTRGLGHQGGDKRFGRGAVAQAKLELLVHRALCAMVGGVAIGVVAIGQGRAVVTEQEGGAEEGVVVAQPGGLGQVELVQAVVIGSVAQAGVRGAHVQADVPNGPRIEGLVGQG